ncbi:MAG TPA: outer membrane beta-barrel protein [Bryobacteraceae bacterium]|nr:outer membrane beta-barrel protein [Bryobacteraceae bacterium]
MKTLVGCISVILLGTSPVAGADYYAGGIAAMATLSADGASVVSAAGSQVSGYKPENGPAFNLFFGRYIKEYVSVQGNFIWNSNKLTLFSNAISSDSTSFYSETRNSSQASVTGDVLVFFRNRASRLRPYLSVGAGLVHLQSSQENITYLSGPATPPPAEFSANMAGLRVAVGIDVRLRKGFWLRYSFSETNSRNPISDRLSPPGSREFKNFQNLWGFVKEL